MSQNVSIDCLHTMPSKMRLLIVGLKETTEVVVDIKCHHSEHRDRLFVNGTRKMLTLGLVYVEYFGCWRTQSGLSFRLEKLQPLQLDMFPSFNFTHEQITVVSCCGLLNYRNCVIAI